MNSDYLVIGGGIIGLTIARTLRLRYPDRSVILLEKEEEVGLHASGRNSGVLHAGFYYTSDSMKARFCRDGNRRLRQYIKSRNLALNECGKLVVARCAADLPQLDELKRRGDTNGVELEMLDEDAARQIEPRVKTYRRALFSPSTATANPAEVIAAMRVDAASEGVQVRLGNTFLYQKNSLVRTSRGEFSAGYVVNAAGLYADRVARTYGFSDEYRIVPFKGLYLYSDEPAGVWRTNVYPVPDLRNPFLGVHFTLTVDGGVKIGPTAIPAFWREQYDGMSRFNMVDFFEVVWRDLGLFVSAGFDFRRLAIEELQKYSKTHLVRLASELASGVRISDYNHWGKSGIRAQLMNINTRKLEMDFVVRGDKKSIHVLNAVSPAWTCALPFADHVCDQIHEMIG